MDPSSLAVGNQRLHVEGSDDSQVVLDRISNLPEEILFHILSFLPTEYAVRTSVLAKRWMSLWLSLPFLDFDLNSYHRGKRFKAEFTNFIDRQLFLRRNSSIQRFRLSYYGQIEFAIYRSWVHTVITCKVRELNLEYKTKYNKKNPALPIPELGDLPSSLFTCNTLVVLKIQGRFVFNVPHRVCLQNLKTLSLDFLIYVDDDSIQRLFSGCPALEDLKINRVGWDYAWTLNVSGPSLKRCTYTVYSVKEKSYLHTNLESKIILDAPNIEYLEITDHASDRISMSDLSSLVEARVSFHKPFGLSLQVREKEYGDHAYGLLRKLSNVRRLSLSGYTLQSLNYTHHGNLPTFGNLVHLELGFDGLNGLKLLPDFLESSPKLEVLIFREGIVHPEELQHLYKEPNSKYRWMPVPECLLLSLKTVEIHEFWGNEEEELNLVKYLLENAMVLERMTIFYHYSRIGHNFFSLRDEFSYLPKGATACKFTLLPEGPPKRVMC